MNKPILIGQTFSCRSIYCGRLSVYTFLEVEDDGRMKLRTPSGKITRYDPSYLVDVKIIIDDNSCNHS